MNSGKDWCNKLEKKYDIFVTGALKRGLIRPSPDRAYSNSRRYSVSCTQHLLVRERNPRPLSSSYKSFAILFPLYFFSVLFVKARDCTSVDFLTVICFVGFMSTDTGSLYTFSERLFLYS